MSGVPCVWDPGVHGVRALAGGTGPVVIGRTMFWCRHVPRFNNE